MIFDKGDTYDRPTRHARALDWGQNEPKTKGKQDNDSKTEVHKTDTIVSQK